MTQINITKNLNSVENSEFSHKELINTALERQISQETIHAVPPNKNFSNRFLKTLPEDKNSEIHYHI